jgi:hypothetical protein
MSQCIRVGIHAPDINDATSYYRGWLPFVRLQEAVPSIQLVQLKDASWSEVMKVDVVFVQRPTGSRELPLLEEAIRCCKHIWCDWDDNVFAVPEGNPTHDVYMAEADNIRQIASMSRLVTVSTHRLHSIFSELNHNTHIVPNAVDMQLYNSASIVRPSENRPLIAYWRGSLSQCDVIRYYADAIIDVMKTHKDVVWIFHGYKPYFITSQDTGAVMHHLPWNPVPACFLQQLSTQADVQYVTLPLTVFDDSRSNTAWMEGTMAGTLLVAPDMKEWRKPGIVNYTDKDSFRSQLSAAIHMSKTDRQKLVSLSKEEILQNCTLTTVNTQRLRLLQQLMSEPVRIQLPQLPL